MKYVEKQVSKKQDYDRQKSYINWRRTGADLLLRDSRALCWRHVTNQTTFTNTNIWFLFNWLNYLEFKQKQK